MNAQTLRISYWLRSTADTDEANPWIITSWHAIDPGDTATDVAEAVSGATPSLLWANWWNALTAGPAGTGGLRAALPSVVQWYRAESAWRIGTGQGDATGTAEYDVPSTTNGARAGSQMAMPLAVVLRKNIASGLKKHRGRNYLPGITTDFAYDGQIASGTKTTIAAAYTPLLSNGVIALFPMIVPGGDGVNRLVSSFDVGPLAGVQRRRLR